MSRSREVEFGFENVQRLNRPPPPAEGLNGSTAALSAPTTLDDWLRSSKARATPHNLGLVSHYGPPTDPSLDGARENDHRTQWVSTRRPPMSFRARLCWVCVGGLAVLTLLAALASQ